MDGLDVRATLRRATLSRRRRRSSASAHVPLPPYMRRADDEADRERYQTVFARAPGAVAAPTAGLHLTHRAAASGSQRAASSSRT